MFAGGLHSFVHSFIHTFIHSQGQTKERKKDRKKMIPWPHLTLIFQLSATFFFLVKSPVPASSDKSIHSDARRRCACIGALGCPSRKKKLMWEGATIKNTPLAPWSACRSRYWGLSLGSARPWRPGQSGGRAGCTHTYAPQGLPSLKRHP
jgi:hypothetical protein